MSHPAGNTRSQQRGGPHRDGDAAPGHYAELFDLAPDAYLVTDREHCISDANRAAVALLSPSARGCVGMPLTDFVPVADREAFRRRLGRALRADRIAAWSLTLQPSAGAPVSVSASVGRIRDERGRIAGHRWILRDGSEVVRARSALAEFEARERASVDRDVEVRAALGRFEQMIAVSSDLMAFVDRDLVVRAANDAYAAVFGTGRADVIGRPIAEVVGEDTFQEYLRPKLEAGLAGRSLLTERWYVSPSGERLYLDVRYAPHRGADGSVTGVIIDARDRTELRRLEEESERRRADLAHVARLSTLGELASGLAHELNQPLSAIASYCAGARRMVLRGQVPPELLVSTLDSCAAQAQRAGDIIRRMRTLVRRDPGTRAPVDLNAVVGDVVALLDGEGRRKDVHVAIGATAELPPVRADRVQIEQVVLNLVLNAIEAVSEAAPRRREVVVRTIAPAGGVAEVQVVDTGPGFTEEAARALFTPFYTTKAEGMGIGLSICRSIVDAHGGTLSAENAPGGGALLRLSLPAGGGEAIR